MANQRKSPETSPLAAPIEPGLVAKLVGAEYSTFTFVGGIIAVYSAWAIWDKVWLPDAIIPTPLFIYLGIGLAIVGAAAAIRYLFLHQQVELVMRRRRWLKEARLLLKEARRGLGSFGAQLAATAREEVERAATALATARSSADFAHLPEALTALDKALDQHLSFARKSTAREYTESIAVAVLIALLLRAFVVEAFKIPSGSMIPTLQVGDHIFVNKFIYGIRLPWPLDETQFGKAHQKFFMNLRKPERGEVIVFKFPKDQDKDFIKRIVAIEGDTVDLRQGVVHVNGRPVGHEAIPGACDYLDFEEARGAWDQRHCHAFRDTIDGRSFTTIVDRDGVPTSWPGGNFPTPSWLPVGATSATVPAGHVFVMGDNRDNSHDSRYWGFVPFELIKGKAMIVWWSSGEPEGIRVKRMGHLVE